jgi:uncharacterized membrane protein
MGLTSITAATPAATTASATPRDEQQLAGWKVGATMAGIAGIASFQQSLLPRSSKQQAIVTAASMALGFGVGVASNAFANKVDEKTGLDAVGSRLVIGGAGAVGVVGAWLALRGRPNVAVDAARTTAGLLGAGALAGAALIGEQGLVDRIKDDVPGGAAAAHAAIIGAAALGTAAVVFGRARSSAVSPEVEAAYVASTREGTSAVAPAFDADRFADLTSMRGRMTTVSGVSAGTLLPDTLLESHGLKFVNEVTPGAEIARVMGVDAAAVKDPIRVYGGLQHAADRPALAQKIFDEALAKGAFDRKHVVLYLPSGTGHVNPMPVAAAEYETLGDIASIGMQYGNKPSLQSVHKVDDASDLFRQVRDRFAEHIRSMPAESRPTFSAYGESLGGWGMHDVFLGTGPKGIAASGLDQVISVGSPRFSGFRSQAIGHAGHRMDPTGTMFEFNDIAKLQSLDPSARDGVRAFLLTHYNDPVNKFSPTMLIQRPEWLRSAEHGVGVPRKMKWLPGVSGIQGIMDTVNGVSAKPGMMARTGHDYRADMAPVMAEILRTGTTQEQLARIGDSLAQLELARVHAAKPVARLVEPVATAAASAVS